MKFAWSVWYYDWGRYVLKAKDKKRLLTSEMNYKMLYQEYLFYVPTYTCFQVKIYLVSKFLFLGSFKY